MTEPSDTRLIELETKTAFNEDLVQQLNDVIVGQERRIELLENQIRRLFKLLEQPQADPGEEPPPPHY